MPFPNERTYSYDVALQLSDEGAVYKTTGFAQVTGVPAAIDLQSNTGVVPKQQALINAAVIVDVTAIKISAGNETYKLLVLLSNDIAFGPGNVEQAGEIMLGKGVARDGSNMMDSVTGRYEIMFSNQVAGNFYQYAALYLIIGGTAPTITMQDAFIAVLPGL
jgi:hypothetical protein